MCDEKEEVQEDCSQGVQNNLQQHHQEMHHQPSGVDPYSPILPWTALPSIHGFNPVQFPPNPVHDHIDRFILPPPPPPSLPPPYGPSFFNRRGLQFGSYEGTSSEHHHHHHLRLISETFGQAVQPGEGGFRGGSGAPFGLQAELQKLTAQEIMDAKALAASKSHSEAERRRRERINNHLAKLRTLLPSTTKTDKASLLAEVIQHVKELKRQTSVIAETSPIPTETDELTVDDASSGGGDGKLVIRASLCCQDRPDLLPDLIKTLKSLKLKTVKADITTLGGRVKNVLFITREEEEEEEKEMEGDDDSSRNNVDFCIGSIQEALRAIMEKSSGDENAGSTGVKRQRTNLNIQ